MIGNSKYGFSCGGMYAIFRSWRKHHLLKDNGCFCNNKNCTFWSDIINQGERNVYESIFNKMKNINFIVDSSKNVFWIKDQLQYNDDKKFDIIPIIIYKTPIEFAY